MYKRQDPALKGWAASSALLGCIIGVVIAGPVSDKLGRRRARSLAAVLFFVSALGTAFRRTFAEFVIFRIVGGVGVGIASMTSPMYIAEVSPKHIRGRMVSINQFAIIFGMLVVYFVNYYIALQGDEAWNVARGWRWMFGSEALPAFALLAHCTPTRANPSRIPRSCGWRACVFAGLAAHPTWYMWWTT